MANLNSIKNLPENAEWSYLYAIADVYQKYSYPIFLGKELLSPHPLTDKEVKEILGTFYNLKNIHRNTILAMRKKLETYFGFKFGTYKKGKYIENNEGQINESIINELALSIKASNLYTNEEVGKIFSVLKSLTNCNLKNDIFSEIGKITRKKENKALDYTIIYKIFDAIKNNKEIKILYKGLEKPIHCIPIRISFDQYNNLGLECSQNKRVPSFYKDTTLTLDISKITEIK